MRFKHVQDLMLPPINGVRAHTTVPAGDFGAGEAQGRRSPSSIPHTGVDMNYFGGQSGINLRHPNVHSPASGTVRKVGYGKSKRISIEDANGILHDILHTKDQFVTAGQKVFAGEKIGTMGNSGTKDHHVHYETRDSAGNVLNPHGVWDQYLEEHQRYLNATGAGLPGGAARDMPRPALPNLLSPDAARPIGGAPRTAPVPFVVGTTRVQQVLDNSLPATGSAPWDLSDRFGNWRGVSGVFGPASASHAFLQSGYDTPSPAAGSVPAPNRPEEIIVDAPAIRRSDIRHLIRRDVSNEAGVFASGASPVPYLPYR